ncbi:MAG: MBL fold metallo-hydrolase [Hymenobacteraceae bacterium]|nr:MBL fold metallo-hydrolase [Hymenobacteraceae bacterium]MDX5483042.1 MBL fold metallo-hydrolase [Hymenobacteraceae bacterium]
MKLTLLRHATLLIEMGGKKILVDPMLSAQGAMEPVQQAGNERRIPMTPLPLSEKELELLLHQVDAVLITHTHRDHWDTEAQRRIPKHKPLFCQPADEEKLKAQGFTRVQAVADTHAWEKLTISRTGGQHGTGEIGNKMGPVSGFVLQDARQRLYIAGDTIWCDEVRHALTAHQPDVVVVNAGAAQFLQGDPITMTAEDVLQVAQAVPSSRIVAVHLDTVNHCLLTRDELRTFLAGHKLTGRSLVPADGESLSF